MQKRVYQNGPGGVGYQPLADNYGRYQGTVDTIGGRITVVPHDLAHSDRRL